MSDRGNLSCIHIASVGRLETSHARATSIAGSGSSRRTLTRFIMSGKLSLQVVRLCRFRGRVPQASLIPRIYPNDLRRDVEFQI